MKTIRQEKAQFIRDLKALEPRQDIAIERYNNVIRQCAKRFGLELTTSRQG